MTGLVAYGQELWDQGVPTRRVLFLLSDGDDNASKAKARDVKALADSLLTAEQTSLAYAGGNATPEDRRFLAGKQIFHTGSTTFTKPMADRYSNNFVTVTTTGRNKDGSCVLSTLDGFYFG